MAMNRVQFQKRLSMREFTARYGTEAAYRAAVERTPLATRLVLGASMAPAGASSAPDGSSSSVRLAVARPRWSTGRFSKPPSCRCACGSYRCT
jgi:hypothetical protein